MFKENALNFTQKGGKIKIEVKSPSSDSFEISVIDNGIGVSRDEVDVIFDEFRVSNRSKNKKGVGLGLSICKKIIEAHKGRIWAEPGKYQGSKFTFILPSNSFNKKKK